MLASSAPRSTGLQLEFLPAREGQHALRQRPAALGAEFGVVD